MVTRYGMSEKLGPILYGSEHSSDAVFLGRDFSSGDNYSEQTAAQIDEEVRRLIAEAENGGKRQREAASRQKDLLAMIEEGTRPSYMYYYHSGHLPASTFATIRERLIEGILELKRLGKEGK
jgi:hypothetical protein